jgi:PAS domain S-box-containing protein
MAAAAGGVGAASAQDATTRVLLLYPDTDTYPATTIIGEAIRRRLQEKSPKKVEFYAEFLDQTRFPGERQERQAARFLADKYAGTRIDAVVALGPTVLRFVLGHRAEIAPDAVVTYCGVSRLSLQQGAVPDDLSGILIEVDLARTLKLAAALQPAARQVVVIAGASAFDRRLEQIAREQLAPHASDYSIRYLTGLPFAGLLEELRRLPPDTIVLLTSIFADGAGRTMVASDYTPLISQASAAPLYAPYEVMLGHGTVGGFIDSFKAQGTATADLALALLTGTATRGPRTTGASGTIVDWRQIERWGFAEKDLPPGTLIRFREPSLWEAHRNVILVTLAAFALQTLALVALLVQVRRRRRAERSLERSEERMAFAAASVNVGLWQYDSAGDVLWATDHCRNMFDIAAGQPLSPGSFLKAIHPDDRDTVRRWLRTVTDAPEQSIGEFRVVQADGSIAWYLARCQVRFDEHGKLAGLSGTFSDITARKLAETEAEAQRQTLAHITRVATLAELSGAIAHEINQPLMAILSNAQAARRLLAREPMDVGEIREALDDIVGENQRANEVIQRLRSLLRNEQARMEPVAINELVPATLRLLRGELSRRGIDLRLELAKALPAVSGDAVQLQQVLINLVMNAMDAVAATGSSARTIVIGTGILRTGEVAVTVVDNGAGVPEAREGRIFEPFYTTKKHGLGLGLAICASIAGAHGGVLRVTNEPGAGARATLILPAMAMSAVAQ